jgi:hypothetical protein
MAVPNLSEVDREELAQGSFYTDPPGEAHFAFTGDTASVVFVSGQSPTDTE